MLAGMNARWLSLAITLLVPLRAHALCVRVAQHPTVLNDAVAAPPEGGLVVSTTVDGVGPDEGEALQPTWQFKTSTGSEKPDMVALAPGLVLYRLPPSVTAAELHDGTKARATVTSVSGKIAELAAPSVSTIRHTTRRGLRGNFASVQVALRTPVPTDALALVVFSANGKRARSFASVSGGATDVVVYAQQRCSALPNGTVESKVGERVTVRWVDKFGRLSAPSKPIKIGIGKP